MIQSLTHYLRFKSILTYSGYDVSTIKSKLSNVQMFLSLALGAISDEHTRTAMTSRVQPLKELLCSYISHTQMLENVARSHKRMKESLIQLKKVGMECFSSFRVKLCVQYLFYTVLYYYPLLVNTSSLLVNTTSLFVNTSSLFVNTM